MKILTTKTDFVLTDQESTAEFMDSDKAWQIQLKRAIRRLDDLIDRLQLSLDHPSSPFLTTNSPTVEGNVFPSISAIQQFPVFVPPPFLRRIRPRDWNDPLLRQVLPCPEEDQTVAGFSVDPLQEISVQPQPGLLQKYQGRILLITTGACAIHCRYCFRRHFPYQESPKSIDQWESSFQQIGEDSSIEEVILSGGDPLMLVDSSLQDLIQAIEDIPHIKRLRIHTRLPIMIPQRVTSALLNLFATTRLKVVMVIHCNHANELDNLVESKLAQLDRSGVTLLNQSVLLKGVNDDEAALISLSQRLFECDVLPYYLHKNDAVAGTSHFEVSIATGLELIQKMRAELPGYLVPQFVQEIAGQPNKVVLG